LETLCDPLRTLCALCGKKINRKGRKDIPQSTQRNVVPVVVLRALCDPKSGHKEHNEDTKDTKKLKLKNSL